MKDEGGGPEWYHRKRERQGDECGQDRIMPNECSSTLIHSVEFEFSKHIHTHIHTHRSLVFFRVFHSSIESYVWYFCQKKSLALLLECGFFSIIMASTMYACSLLTTTPHKTLFMYDFIVSPLSLSYGMAIEILKRNCLIEHCWNNAW